MSSLNDKVAMRHMDVYMEQEEKYTEAVMSDTEKLQSKLQSEMAPRMQFDLSTPPIRWGPWCVSTNSSICLACEKKKIEEDVNLNNPCFTILRWIFLAAGYTIEELKKGCSIQCFVGDC